MDDLQMMREILQKNKQQFEIIEVNNGREALNYLESALKHDALPCLVILDINMPVMDGKETLNQIKKNQKLSSVPVVVFTTSDSDLDRMFCQKLGTEMITKPPSFSSLESTVVRLLNFCHWK
jgi:CheY-like chemotaxis protein